VAYVLSTLRFISNHPLSSRNRLGAFWRYGRWQIESRLRTEIEFEWIDGAKIVARKGMTGATGNIYCGLHEFVDMAFLLHLLRPGDLFIDAGANIGSYSILASAVCRSRSIAFEPDPDTARSLRRNVSANRMEDRVRVVEAALGASMGQVQFTIGLDTTNHISVTAGERTHTVQVTTPDDALENARPVTIMVDVEGYEGEVVSGVAEALARQSLMAIITESAAPPVSGVLEDHGFRVAVYEPFERQLTFSCNEGDQPSNNTLFIRDIEACRARLGTSPRRLIAGQNV
jgi:FkbM family methyltransferase